MAEDTKSVPVAAPEAQRAITPEAQRALSPEAQRALAEAEARRAQAQEDARAKEFGGRGGLEPARYGDWEIKGIACDF